MRFAVERFITVEEVVAASISKKSNIGTGFHSLRHIQQLRFFQHLASPTSEE
jgi:hypothetical protein